uniref:Uncharacterized protein n=1 Tax=Rhizophora mucronata TaxID=61149 RepID=A0A2P2QN41_RHIMU
MCIQYKIPIQSVIAALLVPSFRSILFFIFLPAELYIVYFPMKLHGSTAKLDLEMQGLSNTH